MFIQTPGGVVRYYIPHVPRLMEQDLALAGVVCLATVLQYNGLSTQPQDILRVILGTPADEKPQIRRTEQWANMGKLAHATEIITGRPADYWFRNRYDLLKRRNPQRRPIDVLQAYLRLGLPCVVKIGTARYGVVIGYDTRNAGDVTYRVRLPDIPKIQTYQADSFETQWKCRHTSSRPDGLDIKYQLLAVRPSKPN